MQRNCSTCRHNVNNICENSDWKTGQPIDKDKPPACDPERWGSRARVGYSPTRFIHIITPKDIPPWQQ